MLKVLIVDDEEKICELILHLVDWKAMDLKVVQVLHDGLSAVEYIEQNSPDIVITDIRMPNYDGLEMIEWAKKAKPGINFIVISGYSNFEYAQKAIHYGVQDYLLKPLRKQELENILVKIKEKHFSLLENKKEQDKWKTLAQNSEERVKESLITDLLLRPEKIHSYSLGDLNKEYQSHLSKGYFAAIKIQPFIRGRCFREEEQNLVLMKIQQIVKEYLTKYCQDLIVTEYENSVISILNVADPSLDEIKKQLKRMRPDISNLKSLFQNLTVYIGIGTPVKGAQELTGSLEQAREAVLNRLSESDNYIIEYKGENPAGKTTSDFINVEVRSELQKNLERLDMNGFRDVFQRLRGELAPYLENGKLIYDCYREILNILLYGFKNMSNRLDLPPIAYYEKLYDSYFSLDDIFSGLENEIHDLTEKYIENRKQAEIKPIRLAKQYIYENYDQNLSLENVSAKIGFNPAYFSTLFKKETGINFLEYVMEIRVQKAQNLLISTNSSLMEISTKVGYADFKYFSKIFKRITGLKPTEYRRLYS